MLLVREGLGFLGVPKRQSCRHSRRTNTCLPPPNDSAQVLCCTSNDWVSMLHSMPKAKKTSASKSFKWEVQAPSYKSWPKLFKTVKGIGESHGMEHVSRATPSVVEDQPWMLSCRRDISENRGEEKKKLGAEVLCLLCNAASAPHYWIDLGWAAGSSASNAHSANDFWLVMLHYYVISMYLISSD